MQEDESNVENVFKGKTIEIGDNGNWGSVDDAIDFLDGWTGRAAESFKGVYLDRMPSILCGHSFVAQCLVQSLQCIHDSYAGVKSEAWKMLDGAMDLLDAYPEDASISASSWANFLTFVSGLATMTGAVAAPFTGGVSLVVAAGVVAGTASIGALALQNTGRKLPSEEECTPEEGSGKTVAIEGDTVVEIMDSLYKNVKEAIQISNDMENNLKKILEEVTDFVNDGDAKSGVSVAMSIGDDVPLTRREAFFVPRRPQLRNVDVDSSYTDISSDEMMGTNDSTGRELGVELNQLLKVGSIYVPDFASTFSNIASKDIADGIESGFTRLDFSGSTEVSPLMEPWVSLYGVLQTITSETGERLEMAGEGLVLAAESFAAQDEEAAARLREVADDVEG